MKRPFTQLVFQTAAALSSVARSFERPLSPSDFLILTAYTPEIREYARIAEANKSAYARKYGYHFLCLTDGFDDARPPAWSKVRFIQHALRRHRWVFWSDADSLVANFDIRLESFVGARADIILTEAFTPYPHINTGHMFFRSSLYSRLFLAAVWRQRAFIHDSTWEQRAVNHLLGRLRLSRIQTVRNRTFNSFGGIAADPDPYQPGDFIIHFPGRQDKVMRMRQYAAEIPA
jgi:hypothetical protein